MSGKAPKSILKKSGGVRGPFPSSPKAGPSALKKNTQQNSISANGSKLKKSINLSRPSKRQQKRKQESESEDDHEEDENEQGDTSGESEVEGEDESEVDTDEEIRRAAAGGASHKKKGQKRKRVTTADTFGSTLTALLSEPALSKKQKKVTAQSDESSPATTVAVPGSAILSKSMATTPSSKTEDKLEWKAQRKLKTLKEEREDRARVRDVVEGWMAADGTGGMEFEKGLRKTAQRGVIKLFNAILVASKNVEAAKTTLSAKAGVKPEVGKRKEKDNVLGRGGKDVGLTQEGFLDLVRKG